MVLHDLCCSAGTHTSFPYGVQGQQSAHNMHMYDIFLLPHIRGAHRLSSQGAFLHLNVDFPEQPNEDGDLISDEAINSFVTKLSSGKLTLCIFAVFVVLCVLFFLAMWRSHERREP